MWAPVCQVGKWMGLFGEVDVTHKKIEEWIAAFGPDEKIPVTLGHISDPENQARTSSGAPAVCWISGLMEAGDFCLGNYVDWTPEGLEAITKGGYKNPSIESKDGTRLNSVALLGAREPAVEFHNKDGRFVPLDMAGPCLGEAGQILLAQGFDGLVWPVSLFYDKPPKKVTDLFDDEAGPNAWMKAFNGAYEEYDGDEAKSNATAWAQIEKMGYEKDEDGKYRKPKNAANAAEGEQRMDIKEVVKKALTALLEKLEEAPETTEPEAESAPVVPAEPVVESQKATAAAAAKDVNYIALEAKVDGLTKQLAEQKQNTKTVEAKSRAFAFCKRNNLGPAWHLSLQDYFEDKPEVRLDAEGKKTLPRIEFFEALVHARGTEKLTEPIVLSEPPARSSVEPLSLTEGKIDEDAVRVKAREIALASGEDYEDVLRKLYVLVSSDKPLDEAATLIAKPSKEAK